MQGLAEALAPRPTEASGLVNIQAELLVLLTTLLDVVVWHLVINMVTGPKTYLPLWPLLALGVGGHLLAFILEYRNMPSPLSDGILFGSALGSVLFVLWNALYSDVLPFWDLNWVGSLVGSLLALKYPAGPALALLMFSGYLWNRAINTDPGRPPNVALRFEFALIVLGGFGVARIFDGGAEMVGPVNRAIFWFFLVGMLALALRRAQMEGTRSRPVFSTRWLLLSLAVVGGLLLAGALLATAFSRDLAAVLFQPVLVVLGLIGWVLWTVFTWFIEALFWLLTPLLDFIRSVTGNGSLPRITLVPGWLAQLQAQQSTDPSNLDPLLPVIGGAVVLLALFILWLFWSPSRRRRVAAPGEERESVWEWSMLPDLLAGLRGKNREAPDPDALAALARDPRYRHTVQVRQIYRQLLALGETRGVPRPLPDTADELLPALERVLPGDPAPLRAITDVYDTVRYRTSPATEDEAATAVAAWQALAGR